MGDQCNPHFSAYRVIFPIWPRLSQDILIVLGKMWFSQWNLVFASTKNIFQFLLEFSNIGLHFLMCTDVCNSINIANRCSSKHRFTLKNVHRCLLHVKNIHQFLLVYSLSSIISENIWANVCIGNHIYPNTMWYGFEIVIVILWLKITIIFLEFTSDHEWFSYKIRIRKFAILSKILSI